jgi:hypothetical protein
MPLDVDLYADVAMVVIEPSPERLHFPLHLLLFEVSSVAVLYK